MWSTISPKCRHGPHLLSVSVYNIFVARSYAAVISLSVSAVSSPLDSHRNVSSSQISCLSMLTIYWPCSTLLSLYLAFVCCVCVPFLCHFLSCVWLIALWLLTVFTNLSSIHFMFRYSEIMNIPALYIVYLRFLLSIGTCGSGRFFPVHARIYLCWHKVLNFASELILLSWI